MTTAPFVAARGQSKLRPLETAAGAGWTSASRPGAPAIRAAAGQDGHRLGLRARDPVDPAAEERPPAGAAVAAARRRRRVLRGEHGVEEGRAVGREPLVARPEPAAVAGDLGDQVRRRLHRGLGLAAADIVVAAPGGRSAGERDVVRQGPARANLLHMRPDAEPAAVRARGQPGDRAGARGDADHLALGGCDGCRGGEARRKDSRSRQRAEHRPTQAPTPDGDRSRATLISRWDGCARTPGSRPRSVSVDCWFSASWSPRSSSRRATAAPRRSRRPASTRRSRSRGRSSTCWPARW